MKSPLSSPSGSQTSSCHRSNRRVPCSAPLRTVRGKRPSKRRRKRPSQGKRTHHRLLARHRALPCIARHSGPAPRLAGMHRAACPRRAKIDSVSTAKPPSACWPATSSTPSAPVSALPPASALPPLVHHRAPGRRDGRSKSSARGSRRKSTVEEVLSGAGGVLASAPGILKSIQMHRN